MKKIISVIILSFMILAIGTVSAKTIVAGKIYNADYTDTIAGADVTIICVHGSDTNVQTFTSLSDGAYSVYFNEEGANACNSGDLLTVSAVKDGLYGSETGVVHEDALPNNWDLAVVNVPLVPEFGFIIGGLTILSAIGIFFFARRE